MGFFDHIKDVIEDAGKHMQDEINKLGDAGKKQLEETALTMATEYKDGGGSDFEDCVVAVAAGLAAYGASQSGPLGAAIGAGAGIPCARIACRRVFPE